MSHLWVCAQMPEKRKAQVIVTREDGTQLVYHTNRRDALHQMMLGVGVLSTDRYALLPQSHKCLSHATCLPHKRILALSYAAKGVSLLHALSGALRCCGCYESADTQWLLWVTRLGQLLVVCICMQPPVDVGAEEGRGSLASVPHHIPAQQLLPGARRLGYAALTRG